MMVYSPRGCVDQFERDCSVSLVDKQMLGSVLQALM